MVTSYSEKLEDARENRKKRRGGLGLIALLTCALLILGIGYVNRIYISPRGITNAANIVAIAVNANNYSP